MDILIEIIGNLIFAVFAGCAFWLLEQGERRWQRRNTGPKHWLVDKE